jgi:ATP-dependent DNA helicase RecQ
MNIAFLDTEIDPNTHQVLDIGCIVTDGRQFHGKSIAAFTEFLKGTQYVCGHNILKHDLKYIRDSVSAAGIPLSQAIDTLYWSPLLFPQMPYHALVKDDKLQTDSINNPLNDSIQARDLFHINVSATSHSECNE